MKRKDMISEMIAKYQGPNMLAYIQRLARLSDVDLCDEYYGLYEYTLTKPETENDE